VSFISAIFFQVELQVDARLLQNHIYRTTRKLLPLRDIHTIKAPKGITDWEASIAELEKMRQAGASVNVLAREEDNSLEILVIQTPEMKSAFREFPEIVQMDGTYSLNKAGFPLYGFVVEDCHGRGQLGAMVLTRAETSLSIQTILQLLKNNNPSLQRTGVFVVDKDFTEISAISHVLPDVQIHICIFHVLKAMKKEMCKRVPKEQHKEAFSLLHKLVYARSDEVFDTTVDELKEFDSFYGYLADNWLGSRNEWAFFARDDFITLGNLTNNRVESQFGKVKSIVTQKRRFSEMLRLLSNILFSSNVQSRFRDYEATCKSHYRNGYSGPGADYYKVATPYAVSKLLPQLESMDKYDVVQQVDKLDVRNKKSDAIYSVPHGCTSCSCSFNRSMLLPCRHLFAARRELNLPLFVPELVGERWLLLRNSDGVHPGQPPGDAQLSVMVGSVSVTKDSRGLTRAQKYKKALSVASKLADVVSDCGFKEFDRRLAFLSQVLAKFEAGEECLLIEEDESMSSTINIEIGQDGCSHTGDTCCRSACVGCTC
jgi:zinc finger SWIM domain-containing protein 3